MPFTKVSELSSSKYPKLPGVTFSYGTAGIRQNAETLRTAMFRLGCVAALRSRAVRGKYIGCMITASHNPEEDNGAKLVDPMGNMLDQTWESPTAQVLNASDENLISELQALQSTFRIDDSTSRLVVGWDTRASSGELSEAVVDGAKSLGCELLLIGVVTTPQLHYVVRCQNDPNYGRPTIDGYYEKLLTAFASLRSDVPSNKYNKEVIVDAANGVGAERLRCLAEKLDQLKIQIVNDARSGGKLNQDCGADFVKIAQKPPAGLELQKLSKYASFDGDADRIVYFFLDQSGTFRLLDGDRIANLLAVYVRKLLQDCGLAEGQVKVSHVQTAYANGSSTVYLKEKLGIETVCVPTGVKYLHHEAQKADIGIYFEANGHGTICYSDKLKDLLKQSNSGEAKKFLNFIDLTNETVGDAISDLLLVETVLRELDMSVEEWFAEYVDLPCRQKKVQVRDRTMIKTTDAERICVQPDGLQNAVDGVVAKYSRGRSFVRPSGTENIVRVYAEAEGSTETTENAELLANEVVALVEKFLA